MAKVAARDLQKEAVWRRRLSRHVDSGQSVRAWCRTHRVTETAFYWWRKELARRDAERLPSGQRDTKGRAASFVPVHVTETPTGADDASIEIVLADGRRVRVTGSVDPQLLTAVLEALATTDAVVAERRSC